jgi:hypothetical protein
MARMTRGRNDNRIDNAMPLKPQRGDFLMEKNNAIPIKPQRGDILISTTGF